MFLIFCKQKLFVLRSPRGGRVCDLASHAVLLAIIFLFILLRRGFEVLLVILCSNNCLLCAPRAGDTFPDEVETVFASENDRKVRPPRRASLFRLLFPSSGKVDPAEQNKQKIIANKTACDAKSQTLPTRGERKTNNYCF